MYFPNLKLKAPDGAGVLVPGKVAQVPKMVQFEHKVVVQSVVFKIPLCKPGIMHKEVVSRLQHHPCLFLSEELTSCPACVKDLTQGIKGSHPLHISLRACGILNTKLPEDVQKVQALSSLASEASILILFVFF